MLDLKESIASRLLPFDGRVIQIRVIECYVVHRGTSLTVKSESFCNHWGDYKTRFASHFNPKSTTTPLIYSLFPQYQWSQGICECSPSLIVWRISVRASLRSGDATDEVVGPGNGLIRAGQDVKVSGSLRVEGVPRIVLHDYWWPLLLSSVREEALAHLPHVM